MFRKTLPTCSLIALLAGCSSITAGGLNAVSNLDPLTTPPGDLSAALAAPEVLRLTDGDAMLSLSFAPAEGTGVRPVAANVPMRLVTDADAPSALSGERMYVFALDDGSVQSLEETQAAIRSLKAQGVEGTGSLGISVEGGCLTGGLEGGLPVSTWLRMKPGEPFVRLTRETDFLAVLPEVERAALLDRLQSC